MIILETLKQLRDDLKVWVTNNLNALNAKMDKINERVGDISVATQISSALSNFTETDPTVPAWAKTANKPSYTADEVGARPDTWMPTAADIGAEEEGAAGTVVNTHNEDEAAHNDIRALVDNAQTTADEALDVAEASKTYTDAQIAEKITAALGDIEAALAAI